MFNPDDGSFRLWLQDWVKGAFEVRSVYWPEHKLLGFPGNCYDGVMGLSDAILFQNGTNQDYPPEIWPKLDIFQDIIAQVTAMPDKDVLREMWGESEDDSGDAEYARRSLIYDHIFNALDLDNWLYDREGRFERICMSGIKTSEQADELYRIAVAFAHKIRV